MSFNNDDMTTGEGGNRSIQGRIEPMQKSSDLGSQKSLDGTMIDKLEGVTCNKLYRDNVQGEKMGKNKRKTQCRQGSEETSNFLEARF